MKAGTKVLIGVGIGLGAVALLSRARKKSPVELGAQPYRERLDLSIQDERREALRWALRDGDRELQLRIAQIEIAAQGASAKFEMEYEDPKRTGRLVLERRVGPLEVPIGNGPVFLAEPRIRLVWDGVQNGLMNIDFMERLAPLASAISIFSEEELLSAMMMARNCLTGLPEGSDEWCERTDDCRAFRTRIIDETDSLGALAEAHREALQELEWQLADYPDLPDYVAAAYEEHLTEHERLEFVMSVLLAIADRFSCHARYSRGNARRTAEHVLDVYAHGGGMEVKAVANERGYHRGRLIEYLTGNPWSTTSP